jgi:hypothetical protein
MEGEGDRREMGGKGWREERGMGGKGWREEKGRGDEGGERKEKDQECQRAELC